ncbi:MAG TPA: SCO family protein [Candidatus Angelobacter sp.]|nr:SCO family protein [Candidatus Angelobacter sp.]
MKTRSPLVLLVALQLFATAAIGSAEPRVNGAGCACCAKSKAPGEFTDRSLYQVGSVWTDDAARPVRLGSLKGRPQIITMFFANCQYACPVLVHDMKRIEQALPENVRTNVGFVLVSFDSKRDTVDALRDYRTRNDLNMNRWTLLRGEPDDVLELAALLGVNFKQGADGQFAHSNIITLLNADGEIVHRQIGLNGDASQTVRIITQLLGRPGATP